MELHREIELERLRREMRTMDNDELANLCEEIYANLLDEKSRQAEPTDRAVQLYPVPAKPDPAPEVRLRAIVPEYDGVALFDFTETELTVLELAAGFKLLWNQPIDKLRLEARLGESVKPALQSLANKGAIVVVKPGAVHVSPLIRFEFIEVRS